MDAHVFVAGLIEGYGQEDFIEVSEDLNQFVRIAFKYIHGDFEQIYDLIAHFSGMKDKYEALNWPTFVEPTVLLNKLMFSSTELGVITGKIESCDGDHQCGFAFGELLGFALK